METGGAIRSSAVGPADQPLEVLEPAIAQALHDPQTPCRAGPPRRVVVNRPELLELLPPLLPGVLISQGPTPQVDLAIRLMREQLAGGLDQTETGAVGTYFTEDIGPEAVARFFEAAAALYQRRPWDRIPSDGHTFQVTCSALAIEGWVGCVIGQMRENYGVILFWKPGPGLEGPRVKQPGPSRSWPGWHRPLAARRRESQVGSQTSAAGCLPALAPHRSGSLAPLTGRSLAHRADQRSFLNRGRGSAPPRSPAARAGAARHRGQQPLCPEAA